jgi:hypothetical protein
VFLIDCTGGFGDTIYAALMKYKLDGKYITIRRIHFAAAAEDKVQYHDLVAQMAWQLKKDIESKEGLLLWENDDLKNQIKALEKDKPGMYEYIYK